MKLTGFVACAATVVGAVACGAADEGVERTVSTQQSVLAPMLAATAIPRFATEMPRLPTYAPTLIKNAQGQVIRKEFLVRIAKFTEQQLPSQFPATLLFGYGGDVREFGSKQVVFRRTSPGPTFEQTRLVPDITRYRNELAGEHPLAVDPTLDWANPNNFPKPTPPFAPFPPGYPQAQAPITHTTHTHGLELLPQFDGTPDTWFTQNGIVGPEYVSNDYQRPNTNDSAAFWYHDHSFGVTRLDVGFGLSGFAILRDPAGEPLDRVGNADIIGFEDPNDWTTVVGTIQTGIDTRHTQGGFSTSLAARGFTQLQGRSFALNQPLPASVQLDFFAPTQSPPASFGAVQLYANCPSKGVNRAFLSQVDLVGRPTNQFNTLTFTIPTAVSNSVGSSCEDFAFEVAVNVPNNATGTFLLDNLRGITITPTTPLPEGEFEVPMILQDRSFRTDGSVFYPTVGRNPDVNPYWELIVDGSTNLVNGKVWPNFNVKRHLYRIRMLNSANQRFYNLFFNNGMSFRVIGSDGGYLPAARTITQFQIGVTERVDLLVDFSQLAPGTKVVLMNNRQHFPPIGEPADPNTDGTVMQFTVQGGPSVPPKAIPAVLNPIEPLTPNRPERILIQNIESDDQGRILQAELDGQLFHEDTTELPTIGATEDWNFVNTTPLDHNKHVHLIQFLLVKRQTIDAPRYLADWIAVNGNPPFDHPTIKLPIGPYLTGTPTGPFPEESGWKDTIRTPAGMVTTIRMRFAPQTTITPPQPGLNTFPGFNPVNGIGFVWHCHLVEHEDNEMMRPMTAIPIWTPNTAYPVGNRINPGVTRGVVDFNGVDFESRVAHTSTNQTPPERPDLWERINNQNGDWAVQTIYQVGDRVRFTDGHIYRALQVHQAVAANSPPNPAFWALVL